jgi:hypothetical protein
VAEVRVVESGTAVAALRQSPNAPDVAFVRPSDGSSHTGEVEIAWQASDADGDDLTFSLLMSADGAQTWTPLVVDGTTSSYQFDSTGVPNAADVRLRLVASDGFRVSEAAMSLALRNPVMVAATYPEDGARAVWPGTAIHVDLRDPLDPQSVHPGTLAVVDREGRQVTGTWNVVPGDSVATFQPSEPLRGASRYTVWVTTGMRTADGRGLAADHSFSFSTRGTTTLVLPVLYATGAGPDPQPTATSTQPPTATPGPSVTPSPSRTRAAAVTATATGDELATQIAGTLTALAPTPVGSPTPTATYDQVGTAVAATLTALAPTTMPTQPGPSPTVDPGLLVRAVNSTTTGADPSHMQMAFAAGESLSLWVQVENQRAEATSVSLEWVVVGEGGYAPPELAWSGELTVEPGRSWLRLDRTVPGTAPTGPYQFLGTVTFAGTSTTSTSDFYLAGPLQVADAFDDTRHSWPSADTSEARYGYAGGAYSVLLRMGNRWLAIWPQTAQSGEAAVEADVTIAAGGTGAAGVVVDGTTDGSGFVIFVVDRDGRYSVSRRVDDGWRQLVPWTASPALNVAGLNHLMLVRRGGQLRLYAQNRALATVDDTPAGIRAGVYVDAAQAEVEATFDAFRRYASGR